MAKFCTNCGKALPEGAAFCPQCGKTVSTPQQTPDAPKPAPARKAAAPRAAQKPAPEKPARSANGGGKRGLSFVLTVIMLIELAVAGFKYPGFLLPQKTDPGKLWSTPRPTQAAAQRTAKPKTTAAPTRQATAQPATAAPQATEAPQAEPQDEEEPPAAPVIRTADLPMRYTVKQLALAPAQTAAVSQWEPEADFGNVKVALHSWNLESEDDQLTVKELPELNQGEEGWAIRAYDFSLASGQHEFPGHVAVTIPRTAPDGLGGCVWYNEQTDAWEDVYYELSEDGSSYVIYVDHFSILGEKSYRFDPDTLTLVENETGASFGAADGVFVEVPTKKLNRMLWPVRIDYERMWNLYQKKTEADIRKLNGVMQYVMQASDAYAADKALYNEFDTAQNYLGGISTSGSGVEFFVETKKTAETGKLSGPSGGLVGKIFASVDAILTTLKIVQDARLGKYTGKDFGERLVFTSIPKHGMQIAGSILGIAAAFALGPWVGALIGLLWWAGSGVYQLNEEIERRYNLTPEQKYHQYMTSPATQLYFGDPVSTDTFFKPGRKYNRIPMQKPQSMTNEDYAILKAAVNKKPLRRYIQTDTVTEDAAWWSAYSTVSVEKNTLVFQGFLDALLVILSVSADDGEAYTQKVLDEFYENYARAFWNLNDEILWNLLYLSANPKQATPDETEIMIKEFILMLKQETRPLLEEALNTMMRNSCKAMIDEMESSLLPLLNCRLIFRVEDRSLEPGQTFQDSRYGVNWKKIAENKRFMTGGKDIRYDDPALITPMRFNSAKEAEFLPLLPSDVLSAEQLSEKKMENVNAAREDSRPTEHYTTNSQTVGFAAKRGSVPLHNSVKNYYPYTPDFLPAANKKNNTVYRCSYYHYLMMGAPQEMIFKDVSNVSAYASAQEVPGKIEIPSLTTPATREITDKYTKKQYTVSTANVLKEAEVIIAVTPPQQELVWIGDSAYSGYQEEKLFTRAIKDTKLVMEKDGSFTLTCSAEDSQDHPRKQVNTGLSWYESYETSSSFDALKFSLTGYYNTAGGKGSCSLAGTKNGNSVKITEMGAPLETTTTGVGYTTTLEGKTNFVGISNGEDGERLYIRFSIGIDETTGQQTTLQAHTVTTHNAGQKNSWTDESDETMLLTLYFKKAK